MTCLMCERCTLWTDVPPPPKKKVDLAFLFTSCLCFCPRLNCPSSFGFDWPVLFLHPVRLFSSLWCVLLMPVSTAPVALFYSLCFHFPRVDLAVLLLSNLAFFVRLESSGGPLKGLSGKLLLRRYVAIVCVRGIACAVPVLCFTVLRCSVLSCCVFSGRHGIVLHCGVNGLSSSA